MTTGTAVNQEDVPVSPNGLTNWNGEEVEEYVLPEFDREVGNEALDEVESLIDEFVEVLDD